MLKALVLRGRRRRKVGVAKSLLAGAVGGLAASFVMDQFHSLWTAAAGKISKQQRHQQSGGDDATVKTAEAISKRFFHRKLNGAEKKWAGPVVHYAFGALVGAAYGVLAEKVRPLGSGYGMAYGGAVWLAADEIVAPALKLAQPVSRTPAGAHIKALAMRIVYGLTTDLTRRTIERATA